MSSAASTQASPMVGIVSGVGMGKTERTLRQVRVALDAGHVRRVVLAVPDHRLGAEVEARARSTVGPAHPVATWRGQDQPDPGDPSHRMCRRAAEAAEVRKAGGALSELCGSRTRGFCPFHPALGGACAYRRQMATVRAAHVVVVPHACLRDAPPSALERRDAAGAQVAAADLLVIDEQFWPSMLGGTGPQPVTLTLDAFDAALWDVARLPANVDRSRIDPVHAAVSQRSIGDLGMALKSLPPGRIAAVDLHRAGVTNPTPLRDARAWAWQFKEDPAAAAGGLVTPRDPGALRAALAAVAPVNARIQGVVRALSVVADVLDGRLGPAAAVVQNDANRGPVLRLRWREEIHPRWIGTGGVIHLDATMPEDIVRVFLPGLVVRREPLAAAPFQTVRQVMDTALGYGSLIEVRGGSEDGKRAARNNAARVLRLIETLARRHAGRGGGPGKPDVLAVMPKELEAALAAHLPANVGSLHYGNLRGVDAFAAVGALVLVSRPLPSPGEVEDIADLLFGQGIQRLPNRQFYPKVPGARLMAGGTVQLANAHRHPDPRVEAVRAAICEAELIQAIGRARGVRRSARDPVEVYVLTNTPLPGIPVAEVVTLKQAWAEWGGADPVAALLEAGVVPEDWPGRAVVLRKQGFLARSVVNPADAARKLLQRVPNAEVRLDAALAGGLSENAPDASVRMNVGQTSIEEDYRGLSDIRRPDPSAPADGNEHPPAASGHVPGAETRSSAAPWRWFLYRAAGQRKARKVAVAPCHVHPRAAAEAVGLGPFDLWRSVQAPTGRPRQARHGTAHGRVSPATVAAPSPTPVATVLALPAPPRRLALPPPTPRPAPPALLTVPMLLAALGMTGRDLRAIRLSPRARRLDRDLEARGIRRELRDVLLLKATVGKVRWAAAVAAADAQARQAA